MQRNDLVADEVVAGSNALGDSVGDGSAGLHEGSRAPGAGGTLATIFLDLEPDSAEYC
jgi:hypothetical protein